MKSASAAILAVVLNLGSFQAAAPRTWKSVNGEFSVEASIEKLSDESVWLRNSRNKTIEVSIAKLSQEDREFLANLKETQFEVEGIGWISAPSADYRWELTGKQTAEGFAMTNYRCMVPGSNEVLVMTTTSQVAESDRDRSVMLKAGFNGLIVAYLKLGIRPAFLPHERPRFTPPLGDSHEYALKLKRPDNSPIELRVLYLFGDE